ncbi:hypothetical protein ScPMuIL_003695 [Solemya velum]
MDEKKESEEELRHGASNGDLEKIRKLIEEKSVDVNSRNKVNGWTALHWAAKRGHVTLVKYLLLKGADPTIASASNELAAQVTIDPEILSLLGGSADSLSPAKTLPIVPNYLAYPEFPYTSNSSSTSSPSTSCVEQNTGQRKRPSMAEEELVLKVRIANAPERDFIEVELPRDNLSLQALVNLMCEELSVDKRLVHKIRKLPNTIIRKDKDVKRLVNFQELEIVLRPCE